MSDFNGYGHAVQAGLTAIALVVAIRFILRSALVELFRQRLFEVRRAMFIAHVDAKREADRTYRLMTNTMNSLIRYADHVTFVRSLVGLVAVRKVPDEVDAILKDADDETQKLFHVYRKRLNYEIARHMMLTSPFLWIFFLATLPLVLLTAILLSLLRMVHVMRAAFAKTVSVFGEAVHVERVVSDVCALVPEDLRDSQPQIA